jgi:disulfide bond formation protein DsbB
MCTTQHYTLPVKGSGDCSAVDWTFLGGSIANWSFVCFCAIGLASALLAIRQFRR